MKTVTVLVSIQMDINETENNEQEAMRIIDTMNEILSISQLESQPQIFTDILDIIDENDEDDE
jgi:hypothetical protein